MAIATDSADDGLPTWLGSWFGLFLTLAIASIFLALSSASLPAVVAAHFVAGGGANGYMPRGGYLTLMFGVSLGLPLLLAILSSVVRIVPSGLINVPNRDYWLAPERQAETIAYLERRGRVLGMVLAAFVCFVHWLVVDANTRHPPQFAEMQFLGGALVFVLAAAVWLASFVMHFRRRVAGDVRE